MKSHGSVARLTDIIEAIELIREETEAVSISAFALDRRKQWVVERGLEIISEASRRTVQLEVRFLCAWVGWLVSKEYVAIDAVGHQDYLAFFR